MIITNTKKMNKFNVGDKVQWKYDKGIVKSINEKGIIFVVFSCNNDWDPRLLFYVFGH